MSRSYKKHPGYYHSSKHGKRFANSKVRHYKDLVNGNMYKKVSDSYDICDYKFMAWNRRHWLRCKYFEGGLWYTVTSIWNSKPYRYFQRFSSIEYYPMSYVDMLELDYKVRRK